jgi:hypothetical protein
MNRTRQFYAEILNDVVAVYDQTKTTVLGRAAQKTVNGKDSVGPPLTKFIDVFSDTGLAPASIHLSSNGRLFVVSAPTAGLASLLLYSFDLQTGDHAYIGRVQFNVPNTAATTHTVRGFKVTDTGTTGWKVFLATTGSVLVNGGLFLLNDLALSDFVPIGFPTLPFGAGANQKAVYFLQNPALPGALHAMSVAAGLSLDGGLAYLHTGLSATHQYRVFDYSTAPTNVGQTVGSFTIASPGKVNVVGHGYGVNDQVVFSTTGTLPTGLVAGTVYFVRNLTANDFEVSATSGGASINFTGSATGTATVRRAFGIATNLPLVETGNLPALTGVLLLVNSEYYATPPSGPNAGFPCVTFATSSQIYQGRVSELTGGATTWPSLQTVNLLGTANQITAPTATNFVFSAVLDRYLYITNVANVVSKQFVNNALEQIFGGIDTTYQEGFPRETVSFKFAAVASLDIENGWLLASNTTVVGQRGVFVMDYRSDAAFDYSAVISKVFNLDSAVLREISTYEALFEATGTLQFFYRTSGFGSASGGWLPLYQADDLSSLASGAQIQFKLLFDIALLDASTPAQVCEILLAADPLGVTSSRWVFSRDQTVTGSPARSAFAQDQAYGTAVPKLTFRAYNRATKTLALEKDTVAHAAEFEYSSNNGTSWNALGTIPDGAGTTMVRYNWASPPGVEIVVGLSDE